MSGASRYIISTTADANSASSSMHASRAPMNAPARNSAAKAAHGHIAA